MRRRTVLIAAASAVLLLTAGGLWHTRPLTFSRLCPRLDRAATSPCGCAPSAAGWT